MLRLPLLVFLLVACPRPVAPAAVIASTHQISFPAGSATPWGRHPGADTCFPTTAPDGWLFGGTRHYENPGGLDISWIYEDDHGTIVTMYVYPQYSPPPEGMTLTEAEARAAGSYVTDVAWAEQGQLAGVFGGPGFLLGGVQQKPLAPLIPDAMQPEIARQLGVPSLDGITRAFGTLVVVWTADTWFVKMRATWLDDGRPSTEIVPELIGWPALPCAMLRNSEGSPPILDVPAEELPAQTPNAATP
ncbi:MAG: hypothetical protein V4850_24805 [Myxococcota bacterium]